MLAGASGGVFDGAYSYQKPALNAYLTIGDYYWTITPVGNYNPFGGNDYSSLLFNIYPSGGLDDNSTRYEVGLRPVINIRSDVSISGDGTMENPYKIA